MQPILHIGLNFGMCEQGLRENWKTFFQSGKSQGIWNFFKKSGENQGILMTQYFFYILMTLYIFMAVGGGLLLVCRSKIPLFLTAESCFIMLSFCMCAFCQYTCWVVSGGHFKKILFIIQMCLEKCGKFWKNQGKVGEFHQKQNVETMLTMDKSGLDQILCTTSL